MTDKVTPRPWHVSDAPWIGLKFGVMYQGSVVAECREITPDADKANARHIVKCVNNHERLVEALRDMVDTFTPGCNEYEWAIFENARQLLTELENKENT